MPEKQILTLSHLKKRGVLKCRRINYFCSVLTIQQIVGHCVPIKSRGFYYIIRKMLLDANIPSLADIILKLLDNQSTQVSQNLWWDAIYFKVFCFQEQKHWIGFGHCIFRLCLHLLLVCLVFCFYNTSRIGLLHHYAEKSMFFLIFNSLQFWGLPKDSANVSINLERWETSIMFLPPPCAHFQL